MRRKSTPTIQLDATPQVVIYLRVSTDEQARSGLGMEAQERRCRAWAEASGYDVAEVVRDAGSSAKNLKRPELDRAIGALRPGRLLLAYKMDRLTRSILDFPVLAGRVREQGADLATVEERFDTSTAMGKAMLSMALIFSQLERELIGERTAAALAAKRERRERLGCTPLGYRTLDDGTIVEAPVEMMAVARARQLHAEGHSLRQIAAILTTEGHQTKRGGRNWQSETVRRILTTRYVESLAV